MYADAPGVCWVRLVSAFKFNHSIGPVFTHLLDEAEPIGELNVGMSCNRTSALIPQLRVELSCTNNNGLGCGLKCFISACGYV